jgi:hypothetical protein
MNQIRKNVINSTAKFLLYKQKLKNLLNIHTILKDGLMHCVVLFQKSKKLKSLSKYSQLYKNMLAIQTDITKQGNTKKRNLVINDILLSKSKVIII